MVCLEPGLLRTLLESGVREKEGDLLWLMNSCDAIAADAKKSGI